MSATITSNGHTELSEAEISELRIELLTERIAELEFAREDEGWQRLTGDSGDEFTRDGLDKITRRARLSYLSHPLINHAVEVQKDYVFAQGVAVSATHERINEVIQDFWDAPDNQAEVTSEQALLMLEGELKITGNLVLVLFPNKLTGAVKVRSVRIEEIRDIITNPQDRQDPWYYKRVWRERIVNAGLTQWKDRTAYYPDWRYNPKAKPESIDGIPVFWASPIYHRKVGGFPYMAFGVSELYSAIDWAVALQKDLQNIATIRMAQARFAAQITTKGGSATVGAIKRSIGAAAATARPSNPPPTVASTFIGTSDTDYKPIPLANLSPNPEDARRLWLMVSAAVGIPETILSGNAEVGNLATAKTLDRPTELMMRRRQKLWEATLSDLINYVIDWAVVAPKGRLAGLGKLVPDPVTGRTSVVMGPDPDAEPNPRHPEAFDPDAPMDRHIDVNFPSILERDVKERIDAIIAASAQLPDGAQEVVTRLLLEALGVDDIDEEIERLFPADAGTEDGPANPNEPQLPPPLDPAAMESQFVEAMREMRAALAVVTAG